MPTGRQNEARTALGTVHVTGAGLLIVVQLAGLAPPRAGTAEEASALGGRRAQEAQLAVQADPGTTAVQAVGLAGQAGGTAGEGVAGAAGGALAGRVEAVEAGRLAGRADPRVGARDVQEGARQAPQAQHRRLAGLALGGAGQALVVQQVEAPGARPAAAGIRAAVAVGHAEPARQRGTQHIASGAERARVRVGALQAVGYARQAQWTLHIETRGTRRAHCGRAASSAVEGALQAD